MDAAFRPAAKPEWCLLRKLQPLSLGHLFVLTEHNSPFITGGFVDLNHFMFAVLVCSTPASDIKRVLAMKTLRFYVYVWGFMCRRLNLQDELDRFVGYLDSQRTAPERIDKGSSESNTPFCWTALAMLMADFHMTREQAMAFSVKELLCLIHANMERKGEVESFGETRNLLWDLATGKKRLEDIDPCSN